LTDYLLSWARKRPGTGGSLMTPHGSAAPPIRPDPKYHKSVTIEKVIYTCCVYDWYQRSIAATEREVVYAKANLHSRPAQGEIAYDGVRRLVRDGVLRPGEVFTEGAVASQLGIGRTPCREAISRLSQEGLLRRLPKRGVLVRTLRADDVRDLYAVRR